MRILWHVHSKMLKNTSIGGVSYEIWQFEWGVVPGQCLGTSVAWDGSQDHQDLNKHNFLNTFLNDAIEECINIYVKCR